MAWRRRPNYWRMKKALKPKLLINNFMGHTKYVNNGALLYPHNRNLRGTYHLNHIISDMDTNLNIYDKHNWKLYRNYCKQLGRKIIQFEFLGICRKNNIIPRGLQTKTQVHGIKRNRDQYIHNKLVNRFEIGLFSLRRNILSRSI